MVFSNEELKYLEYVGLVNLPFGNVGEMKSWGADGNIAFNHRINEEMSFVVRGNFTTVQMRYQTGSNPILNIPIKVLVAGPIKYIGD